MSQTSPTSGSHRTALVTGASRGLGEAIARALASSGYVVAGVGRDRVALERLGASIGNGKFVPLVADLAEPDAGIALMVEVRQLAGTPAVLVNNAGYGGPYGLLHETADAQWNQAMAVNVSAPFMLMRECIPAMAASGFGRIVNISSIYGQAGGVGSAAYTAAKHALIGLTKAAAAEYGACGITCNAVCPGFCETEMTTGVAGNADLLKRIPAGRFGKPGEVADLVAWLCSTASGYINGATLTIDGGMSADLAPMPTTRTGGAGLSSR